MTALRRIAIALLSILGLSGALAAVVWAASLAGLAQPVVVATGAMQPAYQPGDLLLTTPVPVADLEPGSPVAVRSGEGAPLAPARLESAERQGDGTWAITTTTDATGTVAEHRVGADAWSPSLRVPLVGGAVSSLAEPEVGLPALAGVGLLVAVVLVGGRPRRDRSPLVMARAGSLRP